MTIESGNMKPFLVAEVAQGYEGQPRLIELFCNAFLESCADAIKFQIFLADELATPDYQYYDLFKSLEVPFETWQRSVQAVQKQGRLFYSDVFGLKSLRALHEIGVDGFKVHSTDVNNLELLKEVASMGKRVLLSTGGCEPEVIDQAMEILGKLDVTLMHGFQAEPTAPEDNHILRIRSLLSRYRRPVGFQDHTEGSSPLAGSLPVLALGAGADLIEKHFTLSRLSKMEDYVSALTAEEFKIWAEQMKALYPALGTEEWRLTEKEKTYKARVKRAVCTRRALPVNHVLAAEDLELKRSGKPAALFDLPSLIGKRLSVPLAENTALETGFLR